MRKSCVIWSIILLAGFGPCAHAIEDHNSDGISDVWQAIFPEVAAIPDMDSDGDGFSNRLESVLGTDPLDPTSGLRKSAQANPDGSTRLFWPGKPGKRYLLDASPDLATWQFLNVVNGSNSVEVTVPSDGSSNRFFRVRAVDVDTNGDGYSDAEESTPGLRMPSIFGDHMVLQRGMEVPVWGMAVPNSLVVVSLGSGTNVIQTQATTGTNGKWRAYFTQAQMENFSPGVPQTMTVESDGLQRVFSDVVLGEVWLCSGQSNMQRTMKDISNQTTAAAAIASANKLRIFKAEERVSSSPQSNLVGKWVLGTTDVLYNNSAAAAYFGKSIQDRLGTSVPIGLIVSARGETRAQVWTSYDSMVLHSGTEFNGMKTTVQTDRAKAEPIEKAWAAALWNYEVLKTGTTAPVAPFTFPTAYYHGMIHPLAPYAIQGVAWYQGEFDTSPAGMQKGYKVTFETLIKGWRATWERNDLPFIFMQLAGYGNTTGTAGGFVAWVQLREAQDQVRRTTAGAPMATATDIGDGTIHPYNKADVGKRMAMHALKDIYGYGDVLPYGPIYKSSSVEGSSIRVSFDHLGSGLMIYGLPNNRYINGSLAIPTDKLSGFEIAGADKVFYWADAVIDGGDVLVSSTSVANPVAVRYSWTARPVVNLYNSITVSGSQTPNLPAYPFRTDTWPAP